MKRFCKIFPFILCLMLTGCHVPQSDKSKVVTEMYVEVRQKQATLRRKYTDPQKMETILSYLRGMEGHDHSCNTPERYAGPRYRIEIRYSDGSTAHVFQHANRFLSRDFQPWQEINTAHAAFLLPLVKTLESD